MSNHTDQTGDWIENIHKSPLPRQYFIHDKELTTAKARSTFGSVTLKRTDEEVQELIDRVHAAKKEAREWAKVR
jgi:hypothetical protein